jgi:hypothetical protein
VRYEDNKANTNTNVINNNNNNNNMFTDVAISGYRNAINKDSRKFMKKKLIEIQLVWNVKAKVIPVTI